MSSDSLFRWILEDTDPIRVAEVVRLSGLPEFIARVLVQRGIESKEEIDAYLHPRLSRLPDPAEMPGMLDPGAARVWQAIDHEEPIVVYGDYDVDGITSTALLVRVLRELGAKVHSFLPHRVDDGYGLGVDPVQRCIEEFGAKLIITVDCGTCSGEAVEAARSAGVDVIITDHHTPAEALAEPLCLLNPRVAELEDWYPLAGVGVAFMFCFAILKKGRDLGKASAENLDLKSYLGLVAVGTVADIVPLQGVNRALVRAGLQQLESDPGFGLSALINVARVEKPIHAKDIGFGLGPRLNAAGRIGTAQSSLDLLLSDEADRARDLAQFLHESNQERRNVEKETLKQAEEMMPDVFDADKDFAVVVAGKGWHSGVVGIVASRLVKATHRPSIVIAIDEDGMGKASCRSVDALHMVDALSECRDLLEKFGGHHMAAGFSIQSDRIDDFRQAFNRAAAQKLEGVDLSPRLSVAAEVELGDVDQATMDLLDQLRPFGAENPEPVWVFRNLQFLSPRVVGSSHLKCQLGSGGRQWGAIGFGLGEKVDLTGPVDVAGAPMINRFRGRESIEIRMIDIQESTGS